MSLFTSKMKLLSAVVIETRSDAVAKKLLSLGLLDFVDITKLFDMGELELQTHEHHVYDEVGELRRRLETIYRLAETETPFREQLTIEQMSELRLDEIRKEVDSATYSLQELREKQKKYHQELLKLREISGYLESDGSSGGSKFIAVNKGRTRRGSFDDLLSYLGAAPHFGTEVPEADVNILITLKRDNTLVGEALEKFQWTERDEQIVSSKEEENLRENLVKKSGELDAVASEISEKIKQIVLEKKQTFDTLWKNLRIHELYGRIQNNFSHTRSTSLFSGWLPADRAAVAEKAIRSASGNECIIEWTEAAEFRRESIPVEIKHAEFMSPFKMLVENYAIPEYGTVDPTVFVAVAYMIMFGLMFGDAGQGAVVVLIGILGRIFMKKASPGIRNLLSLFIYCGSASIAAGILFGSYFGYKLFQPLWFDYHGIVFGHEGGGGSIKNVYDILKITIYFGITVIGTGLILNWINLYKKRDYFRLFLDKSGLIGGWFYGWGIYTAFYFTGTGYRDLPDGNLLFIFFGIPVIILFFKAPLHFYLHERDKKEFGVFSVIDFIMEWIVEILEIFSGYLANTLSFMRVAGLGIAHVSLMVAFDTIAGMTSGISSVFILILGNILVIALEGLSAGIQALRLNYYEFFSRYFTGKGIAYNPVSLRNRKQEG